MPPVGSRPSRRLPGMNESGIMTGIPLSRHAAHHRLLWCLLLVTSLPPLAAGADLRIDWDAGTRRLVQPGAGYARMARLADRRLLITYEQAGKVWIRHGTDDGVTWGVPVLVMETPDATVANAEILVLQNGGLLSLANERPRPPAVGKPACPFRILVSRSDDAGRTWTPPVAVYSGGDRFADGCWEPAALQLPSGMIHLYFANETPFAHSNEQEIDLLRSSDGGVTWSGAERVSFRARHRDGMPVPILLADGRTIAVAIEDDGLSGAFKPVIVTTSDEWRSGAVLGDGLRRWSALATPLPASTYAGAPYLCRLADGTTLLSYQESTAGPLEASRMAVCIGDRQARSFTARSLPFPDGQPQLWNALFAKGPRTVTAITTATIGGRQGIWTVDGTVMQDGR